MRKLSLPVIGAGVAGVLALGVGGALASGVIGGEVQPTSDGTVFVSETTAAVTTDAPDVPAVAAEVPVEATSAPVVVPPVAEAPPATVGTVTEPAPQAPEEGGVVDPESIGTTGPDGNYTPAPPRINPGEPPLAPDWGSSGGGDVTPLPGEPGYTGPVLEPLPRG